MERGKLAADDVKTMRLPEWNFRSGGIIRDGRHEQAGKRPPSVKRTIEKEDRTDRGGIDDEHGYECHHEKRYEKYPHVGLIYAREKDTDAEDIGIVHDIYKRYALNFKNELALFASIEDPIESIAHEIHRN